MFLRNHRWPASWWLAYAALLAASWNGLVAEGADPLTIEKIVAALEKQREQIDSLSLETSEKMIYQIDVNVANFWSGFGGLVNSTYRCERRFDFKGNKRHLKILSSTAPISPEGKEAGEWQVTMNDEQGTNDDICWERRVDLKLGPAQVFVNPNTPEWQWIQNPEYCRSIGWDCKTELFTQDEEKLKNYRAGDMLYVLKHGGYTLLKDAELAFAKTASDMEGANCVAIQRKTKMTMWPVKADDPPYLADAIERIWLDVDRGFAVRQQEWDVEARTFSRTVNSDFFEILPGIWFPRKSEYQTFAPRSAPPEYQGKVARIYHIDLVQCKVNDVPDKRFDLVTKPGDILIDNSTGERRVVEDPNDPEEATPPPVATGSSKAAPAVLTAAAASFVDALAQAASTPRPETSPLRVALVPFEEGGGDAEGFVELLESRAKCKCKIVTPGEIRAGSLKSFDVVVVPGGFSSGQAETLEAEGRQAVRQFVEDGGGYVGICAGGELATAGFDWSLGLINAKTISGRKDSPGPDGIMSVDMGNRGNGIVKMELTDAGRKVLGDQSGLVETLSGNGPIFLPAGRTDLPEPVSLALYRTEIWLHKLQRGTMINTPNIMAARFGKGRVIIFSSHPEANPETTSMLVRAVLATGRPPADGG